MAVQEHHRAIACWGVGGGSRCQQRPAFGRFRGAPCTAGCGRSVPFRKPSLRDPEPKIGEALSGPSGLRIKHDLAHLLGTSTRSRDPGGPRERVLARDRFDDRETADDRLCLWARAARDHAVGCDYARLLASHPPPKIHTPAAFASRTTACAAASTTGRSSSEIWSVAPSSNEIRYRGIASLLPSGAASLTSLRPTADLVCVFPLIQVGNARLVYAEN